MYIQLSTFPSIRNPSAMPTAGWRQVPLMLFLFLLKIAGFLTPSLTDAGTARLFNATTYVMLHSKICCMLRKSGISARKYVA